MEKDDKSLARFMTRSLIPLSIILVILLTFFMYLLVQQSQIQRELQEFRREYMFLSKKYETLEQSLKLGEENVKGLSTRIVEFQTNLKILMDLHLKELLKKSSTIGNYSKIEADNVALTIKGNSK